MAPEQVEGRDADARGDIWAFGAVLYEMVTGERPFAGDTPASVMGAILRDTPPTVSTRQPVAPAALDRLVHSCLAKDPDERWQSIGDVRRMLESMAAPQAPAVDAPPRRGGAWRERSGWITLTILLLAAVAALALWRRASGPREEVVRLSVNGTPPADTGTAINVWSAAR